MKCLKPDPMKGKDMVLQKEKNDLCCSIKPMYVGGQLSSLIRKISLHPRMSPHNETQRL